MCHDGAVLIGLTGKSCAGKDTVADFLEEEHFERHSLSDALRAELDARGITRSRNNLVKIGNELRNTEGPDTLAKRINALLTTDRVVIVSIRNPAEIEEFRKQKNFFLLGVDAPIEIRFDREMKRGREIVVTSLEEFAAQERRENSDDPANQQLDRCLNLADEIIINDVSIPELGEKVSEILAKLEEKYE